MKPKFIFLLSAVALMSLGCNKVVDTIPNPPATSVSNTPPTTPPDNTPPTTSKDIFTDTSKKISLDYTNLSMQLKAPASYIPAQNNFIKGTELLALYVNPSLYTGTNLESAWLELATDSTQTKTTCYVDATKTPPGSYNKTRTVQGNTWYYELPNPHGDAAAGHSESVETYRFYKNNLCYEVDLGASSFNRQNLENPNSVKEYDSTKTFSILGAVFNKLKVK